LYPTISQIEHAAGFTHEDKPQAKLNKLDALLAQTSTSAHKAVLFAEMLSLPNDGRYRALERTPQQRRQQTLEALVLQVAALSRQNPVLMILEDAHWIDPTSLELFGRIVDKIPTLRVLLIVTFRPKFEPPWIGRPYVTALTINRLAEREVGVMIEGVIGNKSLPVTIRKDIIEHPVVRGGDDEGGAGGREPGCSCASRSGSSVLRTAPAGPHTSLKTPENIGLSRTSARYLGGHLWGSCTRHDCNMMRITPLA
jgi:hypothetical protein